MIDTVAIAAQRINDNVPALTGCIEGIVDLANLLAEGAMPQREVCAFVVPAGYDDRGGDSGTGMYTQMIEDAIGVVLSLKALGDAKALKALPTISSLRTDVIGALAGWGPVGVSGVFRATRGRLVSMTKGLILYQLDFALLDQLRIPR